MNLFLRKIGYHTMLIAGHITGLESLDNESCIITVTGTVWDKETKKEVKRSIKGTCPFSLVSHLSFNETVVAIIKEHKETGNISFLELKNEGIIHIKASENRKEINVLIGQIKYLYKDKNNKYLKCNFEFSKEGETVTIWNTENNKLADNAYKLLSHRKSSIIFLCSEQHLYKEKKQFTGYRFEVD